MPNLSVFTITYNEELLMQFMIDHYRLRFPNCNIIVYDNSSTDKTAEIAKANNCNIIYYNANNQLDDGLHRQIKNNCWKTSQTDWVLICDLDELLDITEDELKKEESDGTTIFKPEGWNLVNLEDDYNFKDMKYGVRHDKYDKTVLFNKKYINDISYGAGCHDSFPTGKVIFNTEKYYLYHYKFIHPNLIIEKSKTTAQRLSDINKKNNWGLQCLRNEEELRKDFEDWRAKTILVPIKLRNKTMEHFYKNIQGWFNYQNLYSKVIKELPNNSHIVEVGSWKGMSTAYLAVEIINSGKNIKLDAVDTWAGSSSPDWEMYVDDLKKNNGNIFEIFKHNMNPVKHLVNPIQLPSVKASKLYKNKSLDFVFIDANHTYESAKEDILSWLPKIKSGGFIGGHDYKFKDLPGVTKAVDEIFKDYNILTVDGAIYESNPNTFIVPSFLIKI